MRFGRALVADFSGVSALAWTNVAAEAADTEARK